MNEEIELIQLDPTRDHLETRIIDDVLKHLKTEKDTEKSLRIAVLLAVNLLQFEEDLVACDYVEWMLKFFEPVAGHFDEIDEHEFVGGYKVKKYIDENDLPKIMLQEEYIRYVGGSDLDPNTMPPETD